MSLWLELQGSVQGDRSLLWPWFHTACTRLPSQLWPVVKQFGFFYWLCWIKNVSVKDKHKKGFLTETLNLLISIPSAHNFQLLSAAKAARMIWILAVGLSRYAASWYPCTILSALIARTITAKTGATSLPRNLFFETKQTHRISKERRGDITGKNTAWITFW